MNFRWFKIINEIEFLNTGLVILEKNAMLEGIGQKTFIISKGQSVGITCDGVFIPLIFEAYPMIFEGCALYLDIDTRDIFWGFPVED